MLNHASKKKIWSVADTRENPTLAKDLQVLPATARLLEARGISDAETARRFLAKETERLHDPFLMADMDRAVSRIRRALEGGESIVVYGDYDVDGVTAVTVLYSYLASHTERVRYYIPNRIGEGYGINGDALRGFADDGVSLMITVDTGITAIEEIASAKAFGLDTVITDHHECRSELPPAEAVVNPRRPDCPYPFKELAGVGVAFKLVCALEVSLTGGSLYDAVKTAAARFGDIVSIGTIADVMPLIDENRIIVSYGLKKLEVPSCPGLRALMQASGVMTQEPDDSWIIKKKITSSLVGFTLAPRINAAGRIANAGMAVELFLTKDEARAAHLANELCEINRRRQAEENTIIEQAMAKIAEQCDPDDYVIVLDDDHWHHGVIGIVCSRLTERYNLPAILVSFEGIEEGGAGKGSGRSVKGLNLVEALAACSDQLTKYGGHELAAGLSVERAKLGEFRRAINAYAAGMLADRELTRTVDIDLILQPWEISMRLAEELYLLEPFGVANAQPVFETDRLTIAEITPLAAGRHTKLSVRSGSYLMTALCFGMATAELPCRVGDTVDLVYNLDINEFRGRSSVQLLVRDIRRSEAASAAAASADAAAIPVRDDFARLYLSLKRTGTDAPLDDFSLAAASGMDAATSGRMLDVLAELQLVRVERSGGRTRVTLLPAARRMNLDDSQIYKQMKLGNKHE